MARRGSDCSVWYFLVLHFCHSSCSSSLNLLMPKMTSQLHNCQPQLEQPPSHNPHQQPQKESRCINWLQGFYPYQLQDFWFHEIFRFGTAIFGSVGYVVSIRSFKSSTYYTLMGTWGWSTLGLGWLFHNNTHWRVSLCLTLHGIWKYWYHAILLENCRQN